MELNTNKEDIEKLQGETILSYPIVYGCFSLSGKERTFSADAKQLRYWNKQCPQPGKVDINLDDHPENNIKKENSEQPELLNNLLQYFITHKRSFVDVFSDNAISLSDAHIICYRGFLRLISSIPYCPDEPIRVNCCLYRGGIYLYHLNEDEQLNEFQLQHTNWGHKFEQYMVARSPDTCPDISGKVIQSEEFGCIFRADLDKHHLIYGAEVDGVIVEDEKKVFLNMSHDKLISELHKSKFIELKTKNSIKYEHHKITFSKYNSIKWWLQSFYGRSEIILCGFKNPKTGVVRDIKKFDVLSLPDYSNGFWNSQCCLNFCNTFISYVKSCLSQELNKLNIDEKNIRSAPKIEIMIERKDNSHFLKKCECYPENFTLIPDWYIKSFDNLQ